MVTKVNDSILENPTNILELNSVHHLSLVDMNLNVKDFYKDVLNCILCVQTAHCAYEGVDRC